MRLLSRLSGSVRCLGGGICFRGSVGFFQPNGDFDLNVVIRSLLYNAATPRISMHVGGAITSLSDPASEYAECLLKAEAMMQTLNSDGE